MIEILTTVGKGMIFGAVYGISGYVKNIKKQEEFDIKKLLTTAGIGGVIGLVMNFTELDYVAAENMIVEIGMYGGLTAVIENIIKSIFRK